MERTSQRELKALEHLYVILDAGERGYAVAAANVNKQALKMLLQTYARQRFNFKHELAQQMEKLRANLHSLIDLLAIIHWRGINIFAMLTIGEYNRERVVLKEVLVGEGAALKAYEKALTKHLLPDAKALVQRQYGALQNVIEQVTLLRGTACRQLLVRLYDTEADASRAVKSLQQANLDSATIEKVRVRKETEPYQSGGQRLQFETILSGLVGGALWGSVSATLTGFGMVHLPGLGLEHAPLPVQEFAWAQVALGSIAAGAFVGAILGTFIG